MTKIAANEFKLALILVKMRVIKDSGVPIVIMIVRTMIEIRCKKSKLASILIKAKAI